MATHYRSKILVKFQACSKEDIAVKTLLKPVTLKIAAQFAHWQRVTGAEQEIYQGMGVGG